MKKYLFLLLAATLFVACNDDEDEKAPVEQTINFADYSSAIGLNYAQMLAAYGEPSLSFGDFYSFDINDGKTESLVLMTNPDNNKVYSAMQILAENAYKFEDIYDYFASKYTKYQYLEQGTVIDGETMSEAMATFGNAAKEEDATLMIVVAGNTSVSYTDLTNVPEGIEGGDVDFSDVAPEEVPSMFLGRSWSDIEEEYGDCIQRFNGALMINVSDNPYYSCIYFTVEDGIVTTLQLLFDDMEDEEVIAYYEALGYTATDCGEEDGVHSYLFVNASTGDVFSYTNPVATFAYNDPDAE